LRTHFRLLHMRLAVLLAGTAYGTVKTVSFLNSGLAEEFRDAVDNLLQQGANGLVLDLRDNGGDLIREAAGIASDLLESGLVVYDVSGTGVRKDWPVLSGGLYRPVPLRRPGQ